MSLFTQYSINQTKINLEKKYNITEYVMGVTHEDKHKIFNNVVYTRYVVDELTHNLLGGDKEMFFENWFNTDKGKWISKHGKSLCYYQHISPSTYDIKVRMLAHLTPEDYTFFVLKFST